MSAFRPTRFNMMLDGGREADACGLALRYGGGKSQTTQSASSVSIPPEVLAQYNAVNAQAETVAQTPFQQYSNGPNAFVAPLDATQQAGILGTNQYSNEAQPFYQTGSDMTQAAGDYTQNAMNATTGAMGMTSNALNPAYANTAGAMTLANSGAADPSQLNNSAISQYMNPYLQNVVAPTAALMQQQFGQAQSGQMGNAIQNGAFGGDRQQLAAANLQQQQGLAYGQTMGGLMNNAYTNALSTAQQQQGVDLSAQQANLQRGLAGAQQYYGIGAQQQGLNLQQAGQLGSQAGQYGSLASQYGSLGNQMGSLGAGAQAAGLQGAQAQLAAGQAQQETEQAGLTALYNQFLQQQSYPFQTTQFLANIAEGTGALSGSTTSGSSTSPSSFFSDERLKDDIRDIGRTHDGQKIIEFRYKGEHGPKRIGLSAQDVEKHHPEAVGLAGGYRTVDYDRALAGSEREHHASGGLAGGNVVRLKRDMGGNIAGLSPNSAWSGGFNVDPSYLSAMEQAYASAPWGGSGAQVTGAPYGGKSPVPPSSGSHGSLAVSKPPQPHEQQSNGLQQATQGLGQLEKLGESGKKLFDWGKSGLAGLSPASTPAPTPAPVDPSSTPSATPPDASGGALADAGLPDDVGAGADLASTAPDMSDLSSGLADMGSDIGDIFAARGGSMRRGLAGGGASLQYSQPTDDSSSDEGDGGSIPFLSGTGEKGLDIPDDRSNNHLAVADLPSSGGGGGGGGGFNPMSAIGPIIGLAGLLKRGGRVHRDAGGGLAPPEGDGYYDESGWHSADAASAPVADAAPAPSAMPRDITVHKSGSGGHGRGADAAPAIADAAPAIAQDPPATMGLGATSPVQDPLPGSVSPQEGLGAPGDWFNKNQGWAVPAMKGVGKGLLTALSSNSRYLGSALGQGLGAGLGEFGDAYEGTQDEMLNRTGQVPDVQRRQGLAQQVGIETLNQLQDSYLAYKGRAVGTPMSFEQYAASMGVRVPGGAKAGAGAPGAGGQQQPGGQGPQANYTYQPQELQGGKVSRDGTTYPLASDPLYLQQYYDHWAAIPGAYAQHQAQMASSLMEQARSGRVVDSSGRTAFTPGTIHAGQQQQYAGDQTKMSSDFVASANDFQRTAPQISQSWDDIAGAYQNFRSGKFGEARAQLAKISSELGIGPLDPKSAASYDLAAKTAARLTAQQLQGMPGGAPKAEIGVLSGFSPDPREGYQPSAIRSIVTRGKAALNYASDLYKGYDPNKENFNLNGYINKFNGSRPYGDTYIASAEKSTPWFAGMEPAQVANPHDVAKLPSGAPYIVPSGQHKGETWYAP